MSNSIKKFGNPTDFPVVITWETYNLISTVLDKTGVDVMATVGKSVLEWAEDSLNIAVPEEFIDEVGKN